MFCRGCVFAPLSDKILNMTQPKLSPRDIWHTLIFACPRTFESVGYVENSLAKNNIVFHRNSHSCNGYFDWCIGFLKLYWYFSSVIICIDYHYENGYRQFAPCWWTNENLFDMRSSLFKMSNGKKQKSTKLYQNFCCSACGKEMPRHYGLGNRCTSTSCHSATMTILAMHLIGRWNWNGKSYGKWCARRILVPKSREVLQFINTIY